VVIEGAPGRRVGQRAEARQVDRLQAAAGRFDAGADDVRAGVGEVFGDAGGQ
jgi:hypothetical protein